MKLSSFIEFCTKNPHCVSLENEMCVAGTAFANHVVWYAFHQRFLRCFLGWWCRYKMVFWWDLLTLYTNTCSWVIFNTIFGKLFYNINLLGNVLIEPISCHGWFFTIFRDACFLSLRKKNVFDLKTDGILTWNGLNLEVE